MLLSGSRYFLQCNSAWQWETGEAITHLCVIEKEGPREKMRVEKKGREEREIKREIRRESEREIDWLFKIICHVNS